MTPGAAPLRIVMVSAGFHPYLGGSEKQALELSVALGARGHQVSVLTRRLPGLAAQESVRGVGVRRLWRAGNGLADSLTFMASLAARLWRTRGDYDAIHAHLAGSPALSAAIIGRLAGKPVVVKLGGGPGIGELAASAGTWSGRLKLRLLRGLDPLFVAVTKGLAEEAAAYGLDRRRVRVCPNGVDTVRHRPADAAAKAAARRELGWPEGMGFIYVGRLSAEKRLGDFLEAFDRAATGQDRPAFAVLVGDGPESATLRARAASLASRVLVTGSMPDIEKAYAAADVFILPSISEGLSNALLEAMASGLAVAASRVGGAAELLEDGVSALFFEPGHARVLEGHLRRLLGDPVLAGLLGRRARAAAEACSVTGVALRYEELYRGRA